MRNVVVAANWKLNKNRAEAKEFLTKLERFMVEERISADVLVLPPFTMLQEGLGSIQIGAQNVSAHQKGAYTGEVSIDMVAEAGAQFTLIGHSERRDLFGESDALIKAKVEAAIDKDFPFLLCVGESAEDHAAGDVHDKVREQLRSALGGHAEVKKIRIAYEPKWAIGSGETPTADFVQHVHACIREELRSLTPSVAENVQILYGGSVTEDNIESFVVQEDVDGCLVGGASLDVEQFCRLITIAEKSRS